ncbi:MAG TPA: hypothetical protein VEF90_16435 [Xanthobacteraceae bacterium]|nr:hypothetical protein [Xanthobacteraceae bacterium]
MATTGSQSDIASRLRSLLPPSWFPDPAPDLWSQLQGFANIASWLYGLIAFAKLQTRISTATGFFLDLIAFDFFGRRVRRKPGQNDASLRTLIKSELVRPRQTRAALASAVAALTNAPVTIFEPWNAGDTGGFDGSFAFDEPTSAWGSQHYPYQVFLTAVEPSGAGIPYVSGFDDAQSGFDAGWFYFADPTEANGHVTNQDIYDAINATRAAGITVWTNISAPPVPGGRLDMNFVLDGTPLA